MKCNPDAVGRLIALVAFAGASLLVGCGDFWQNPNGTSTGTTSSSISLSISPSGSTTVGTSVTLTATVTPSAATGTVIFYNSGTELTTGTLSSGTATATTSFTTAGTESLTATYVGNSTYAQSTSSAVSLSVTASTSSARGTQIAPSSTGRETNIALDPTNIWTLTANSYLHDVSGVVLNDGSVQNIDGSGYCLYYSGSLYFAGGSSDAKGIYPLMDGGFLAPVGTAGLDCQ